MVRETLPCLVADAGLGKLVTYLRLAGIDTLYDPAVPEPRRLRKLAHGERIILTRSRRVKKALRCDEVIFIHHDRPLAQVRQVMSRLALKRSDLTPLNRCSRCNQRLEDVPRNQIVGSVPDYIAQVHDRFHRCSACGRIYWSGTHAHRWLALVDQWFED